MAPSFMKRLPRLFSISMGAVPQGPEAPPPMAIQPRGVGSIMPPAQQAILWPWPLRVPAEAQLSAVAPLRSAHSMPSFSRAQHISGLPMKSPAHRMTPLLQL